jgi:hypothetical protein
MSKSAAVGWKAKMPFLEGSKPVRHEVQGTPLNFYPSSIGCVFKLKGFFKPVIEAVSVLFESTNNDRTVIQTETTPDKPVFISGNKPGEQIPLMDSETIKQAVSPDIAAFRIKTRKEAINQITSAIDESNLSAVGELIMDSLKELFPRNNPDNPPGIEFAEALEAPAMVEMLVGVFKANKGVFGPLGGRLSAAFDRVTQAVETKAKDLKTSNPEDSTPGPNYKINSAGSPESSAANSAG